MPAQQASQYPIGHYIPEYNPVPLSTQRRSFDTAPALEVRTPQYAATIARYPNVGHQYSSSYPQYAFPHHAPPPSLANTHNHHNHHNHHHHHHHNEPTAAAAAGSTLPWYSAPTVAASYTSATPTLEASHHAGFHAHFGYHQTLVPLHDCPHMDIDNYQSLLASPPDHHFPPASIPVSPTHSTPASISPSVEHAEYASGALAGYSRSLPLPLPTAHDDPARQPLLTSLRNSPPDATIHHRTQHSLTSYDTLPSSLPPAPAHQYNPQPQPAPSISGIPTTNGSSNRARHAHHHAHHHHHSPSSNLYSPYSAAPRPSSSSSSSPDPPRPHVCGICHAAFQRNHDLKRHKDVHSDTKPYVCQCGRAFTRKDALKRHIFLKSCGKDKGHESA